MLRTHRCVASVTFRRRVQIQSFAIGLVIGSIYVSAFIAWRLASIVVAVAPTVSVDQAQQ